VFRTAEFQEKGYVLVKELLPEEAVKTAVQNLDRLSEQQRRIGGWTTPDGLTQTECFWPLIFDDKLLATVRGLLGENIRFLQHNDLHVDFSSYNWHRDSVSRKLGEGPDWDETEPYRIVRVGFYLQPRSASAFQLGLLPGTHRLPSAPRERNRRRLENMTGSVNVVRRLVSGRNPSPATAEWLAPANGDAVIFDPRVIHTGSRSLGSKYSVFLAYGVPNNHYFDHATYYRFLRPELGYQPIPPMLVEQLKASGLYQEVVQTGREIPGATIPGFMQSLVARRIRHRV
jgi:hypothetical protein